MHRVIFSIITSHGAGAVRAGEWADKQGGSAGPGPGADPLPSLAVRGATLICLPRAAATRACGGGQGPPTPSLALEAPLPPAGSAGSPMGPGCSL